ncbi:pilus assembly protein PilQ [bacterium]|nr:pilus assembly protein PilQ [bacterium]|tara:strand:+ start:499 stop:2049 length:1551 start_codon:yes stop_codon:yes gene_type:complete
MNIKSINKFVVLIFVSLILSGCVVKDGKFGLKKNEPFKHNSPLIKKDIKAEKKAEMSKTVELGPKPVSGDTKKLKKRKIISSEIRKDYLTISDNYPLLKQNVTFRFKNIEFKEAMEMMGKIGEINILVGEEITGSISAELINVNWDKAFQALLDMKNYAADIDTSGNLIRIHLPETLSQQETYKSARADVIKKKVEVQNSTEPIYSEIFRLYYITPAQANNTITQLFSSGGNSSSIQITEEETTRSLIVRGKEDDLNTVNKVLKEIDIKTEQVLIEAFIVEASSEFERTLGVNLGGYYYRQGETIGGTLGTSTGKTSNTVVASGSAGIGTTNDGLTSNIIGDATSGIGILKRTGSAVLKAEIEALEKIGLVKQISNPKIFTLNNQIANVVQGTKIPYQSTGDGGGTSFADAALQLQVTPSIVGDGNVLLDINLTNNSAGTPVDGAIPINTMEIVTKLLVADGDVVVIGGIKKEFDSDVKNQTPGLGNAPVIGNLFKGKQKKDTLNELLVFIAPRVL